MIPFIHKKTIIDGLEMQRLWCIFQVGKGSSSPLIGDHELESGGMGGLGIKEVSDWVLNHMQDFSKFLDVSIEGLRSK
jgi:hypothetical protein